MTVSDRPTAAAASSLIAPLFDGPSRTLHIVAVTPASWHLTTSAPAYQVVSLQRSRAIVLPCSVVYDGELDLGRDSTALIGAGVLRAGTVVLRPRRWWAAPRPRISHRTRFLAGLAALPRVSPEDVELSDVDLGRPQPLLGRGPGLTPAGDDVLAGSLVLLNALGEDPRADWCDPAALQARTSALSAALLHHARHGYCLRALAVLMDALDRGIDPAAAVDDLFAVGGTSGRAMLLGLQLTVDEGRYEDAA